MYTWTDLYSTHNTICKINAADTTNIANGKLFINDIYKRVLNLADWTFLDDEWYAPAVGSQEAYRLPHNYGRLVDVWVQSGSLKFVPKEIANSSEWTRISSVAATSNFPQFYNVFGDYIHFYPSFADATVDIHLRYKQAVVDMSFDDITTGIVTPTPNSIVITGSGTTFTPSMVGKFISIVGDKRWYELAAFNSSTSMSLVKDYEGPNLTNAQFRLGELPLIPDGFQDMLWQKAASFYLMLKGEEDRSKYFKELADEGFGLLRSRYLNHTSGQTFQKLSFDDFINPNDYPLKLAAFV